MSVRVDYTGEDDDFAWILPVVAPPEISIGTDALFDTLRRVTEPTFVARDVTEGTCRPRPRCVSPTSCAPVYDTGGCANAAGPSDPWTGGFVDAAAVADASAPVPVDSGPPDPGVMVFSQGPIGPYDTVVLGAATAAEVVAWLVENGYEVPAASTTLLEPYAAAGHVFVALRLRTNVSTRSIRPIVLRMPTREACLPIRLTAIATVSNLPIAAFFLARAPVTPANFSTVELEPDDPAFWTGERLYRQWVAASVLEMGGQAFARDYSGPTPAVGLALEPVDDLAALGDPTSYLQELSARGYQGEPILLELFERFLQPPADYPGAAVDYYNCLFLGGVAACGEPSLFDPAGLTAEITASLTIPRAEAQELVNRHGHLTRLSTTMRAQDMTLDPVFVVDEGLEDRDNVFLADRVTECSADYFGGDAPRHWQIGEERFEISAGTLADDRAYCAALDGIPASEARECPSMESSRSGGCLCFVGGAAPAQGGALVAVALLLGVRRLRRGRATGSSGSARGPA